MVHQLLPDVSRTIFRPAIVLGDSRRPETTQFDMVQAFSVLASLPVLPLRPADRIDIVPADYVGKAIVSIHQKEAPAYPRYHLSCGTGSQTYRELTDALRAELFHRREELAFLYGEGPSRLERVSRRVCYLALAVSAGVVAALLRTPPLAAGPFVPLVWGAATLVALFAAVVARGRTEHRTDPKGERRLRFWSGPPGRWLFALARLRLPPLTPPPGARGA